MGHERQELRILWEGILRADFMIGLTGRDLEAEVHDALAPREVLWRLFSLVQNQPDLRSVFFHLARRRVVHLEQEL